MAVLQSLTAGLSAKTWSDESDGYASDAVDLGSSSGKGCCCASDGLDRLDVVKLMTSEHIGCIPED